MVFPHYQVWIDLAGKREAALVLLDVMVVFSLLAVVGVKFNFPRFLPAARLVMVGFFFLTLAINWML